MSTGHLVDEWQASRGLIALRPERRRMDYCKPGRFEADAGVRRGDLREMEEWY
jgi:hypothetical protein